MNSGFSNIHEASILGNGIKVMVIDHKQDFLASVCEILKSHSFEVTCVDKAAVALRILTERKKKYDLLLIASDMRDVDVMTFLRLAKNMDVLSMVMHQEIDDEFLLKVLENGGSRIVKTPLTDDAVMYARDDVIRARFNKFERYNVLGDGEIRELERENRPMRTLIIGTSDGETRELERGSRPKRTSNTDGETRELERGSRPKRTPNGGGETRELERGSRRKRKQKSDAKMKFKRVCMVWTKEVHDIYLQAIHELGEGNCFPRTICDAMGVPGLTRLQVASHLQRCRLGECKFLQNNEKSGLSTKRVSSSNLPKEVDPEMLGNNSGVATDAENNDELGMNINDLYPEGNTDVNQSIPDISLANGIGFENFAEGYSVPTDYNSFPLNEVSTNYSFELFNGMGNPSLDCMEFNLSGQNNNIYDQVMPAQGIPEFNQYI